MHRDTEVPNFVRALGVLGRRAPVILVCFLVAGGTAFVVSRHETKRYTATASLVFNNDQLGQQVAGLPAALGGNPQAQQNTNLRLVELGDMAAKTASVLGQGLTEKDVTGDLSIKGPTESNIVEVSATSTSPTLAADIANTYSEQFVSGQQNSNHAYYASALELVNRQLSAMSAKERATAAGLALQDRAQSLGVLAELRNGNVQIAQAASVPSSPSSPTVSRNTIVGALLGLLLGLGIALLLERLDRRIREPKDLETIYGLPLLGVVPESTALAGSSRRGKGVRGRLPQGEAESFHLIRAHLRYFNVDRQLHTLLVASAAPGDGKTTVARHLAGTAATMGSHVLLLEADLRRPTLAQQLDVLPGHGLSDVLIGVATLDEAVHSIDVDELSGAATKGRTLDVVVAGSTLPPNPGELIESHAMESLLEQAKARYDLVVIDTPPLTAVSDAFPLLRKVDGVIIVGRVGRNRRDIAERLHDTLKGSGAPLLGVVANGFKSGRLGGSYGYTYDYAGAGVALPASEIMSSPNGAVPTEESVVGAKG